MLLAQPHERQPQPQQLRQQPQRQREQPHEEPELLSDTPPTAPDEQPQVLPLPDEAPEDWQQGLQQELATKFGNTMPPQTV